MCFLAHKKFQNCSSIKIFNFVRFFKEGRDKTHHFLLQLHFLFFLFPLISKFYQNEFYRKMKMTIKDNFVAYSRLLLVFELNFIEKIAGPRF